MMNKAKEKENKRAMVKNTLAFYWQFDHPKSV